MDKRLTYAQKLQDPRWLRKRSEVLARDNFTCRCCAEQFYSLHVHHQQYNGEPWQANMDFLISLCESCHRWVEEKKKIPLSLYQAHIIWTYDAMLDGDNGLLMSNRQQRILALNYIISYAYGEQNQVWR